MSGIISYLTFFPTIYTAISFRQKKSNFYQCHILLCFYSHFPITLGTLVVSYDLISSTCQIIFDAEKEGERNVHRGLKLVL